MKPRFNHSTPSAAGQSGAGFLAHWCLAGFLALALSVPQLPGAEATPSPLPKNIQPILTEYCYDCHADGANKGKVAFDEFKSHDELGGDAGKILQGIGLGGKTTSTNAPTTNAPSNVLQGIGGLFQKPAKTNAPATKIPPKKNDGLNLNNLLK